MEEQIRRRRQDDGPEPTGLGGIGEPVSGGTVTVMNGPYAEQLPIGGLTVGEVRGRFQARFDIDPQSLAVLDGDVVDDSTVIGAGQLLRFSRKAGEKGTLFNFGDLDELDAGHIELLKERLVQGRQPTPAPPDGTRIELSGSLVMVTTPEKTRRALGLDDLLQRLRPERMSSGEAVLPDGVKAVLSEGPLTIWVHQTPPRVHNLRWIAEDSPDPFGPEAQYREVKIALPYVVVMVTFLRDPRGQLRLVHANECYFRNEPLRSLDDELLFPALLNCSKYEREEGRALSWICTQHLNLAEKNALEDENRRLRGAADALLHCLFDTAFNYSSDHHEGSSWFTESRSLDPRIASIEAWEAATGEDPRFATDVPWRTTGRSVREIGARMADLHRRRKRPPTTSDVARIVLNHGKEPEPEPPEQGSLDLEIAS